MNMAAVEATAEDRQARRNALLLAAAQGVGGGMPAINIALGGLTGAFLLGADKSLATLPITALVVGVALGAIPAAMLMSRLGRRTGFLLGACLGMIGGVVAGAAILAHSFVVFVLAMVATGLSMSFVQQYRFAAADAGSPKLRARAISWVLAGGLISGVVGPQMAILTRDLFAPTPFAGAYFGMSLLAVCAFLILLFLGGPARMPPRKQTVTGGRPLLEIALQPRFVVAVICGMGSYAVMSLLMTAAPLAMIGHGHSQVDAALGIQWHVLAMFGPSFVTGWLIARYGHDPIIAIGFVLLAGCAGIALTGVNVMTFWLALIVLGLGWNFAFVGATVMLTGTYRPEEKSTVQGGNDFLVFGSVALASLASGRLLTTVGWTWINVMAFPITAACMLALAAVAFRRYRSPA